MEKFPAGREKCNWSTRSVVLRFFDDDLRQKDVENIAFITAFITGFEPSLWWFETSPPLTFILLWTFISWNLFLMLRQAKYCTSPTDIMFKFISHSHETSLICIESDYSRPFRSFIHFLSKYCLKIFLMIVAFVGYTNNQY